jgi:hypothetical protein
MKKLKRKRDKNFNKILKKKKKKYIFDDDNCSSSTDQKIQKVKYVLKENNLPTPTKTKNPKMKPIIDDSPPLFSQFNSNSSSYFNLFTPSIHNKKNKITKKKVKNQSSFKSKEEFEGNLMKRLKGLFMISF